MRIERVELTNWKQHRNLTVELTSSTVGLIGRVGKGKSNFMGAISDLMTGEFTPSQEEIVTWGETQAKGKLRFSLNDGRKADIELTINKGGKTTKTLKVTGEKDKITGASKVNARILELLGTDKSVLTNIVFVPQDKIQELLFSGIAKERMAARFYGLERAQGLEKFLSSQINLIQFDSSADQATSLRCRLADLDHQIRAARKELDGIGATEVQLRADYDQLNNDKQGIEQRRQRIEAHKAVVSAIAQLNERITAAEQTIVQHEQAATQTQAVIAHRKQTLAANQAAVAGVNIAQARALRQQHEEQLRKNSEIDRISAVLAQARHNLAALGQKPHTQEEIDEHNRSWGTTVQLLNATSSALQNAQSALAAIDHILYCPYCLSEEKHWKAEEDVKAHLKQVASSMDSAKQKAEEKERLEKEIVELTPKISHYTMNRDQLEKKVEAMRQANSQWEARERSLNESISLCETSLLGLGEKQPADPNQYISIENTYNELVAANNREAIDIQAVENQFNQLQSEVTRLRNDVVQTRSSLQERQNQLSQLTDVVDSQGNYLPVEDPSQIQVRLQQIGASLQKLQTGQDQIRTWEIQKQEVEAQLAQAEAAEHKNADNKRFQQALVTLRDQFHPDGAPKTLITRNNRRCEGQINSYLGMLEADFTVATREGMDFDCIFPGGVTNQTILSGGQKIELSVAFRLGSMETFSSGIGLMCLDEPTVWLDEETRARFCDLVESLKALAERYQMQFIVSTHEQSLIPHFGQVLKFT